MNLRRVKMKKPGRKYENRHVRQRRTCGVQLRRDRVDPQVSGLTEKRFLGWSANGPLTRSARSDRWHGRRWSSVTALFSVPRSGHDIPTKNSRLPVRCQLCSSLERRNRTRNVPWPTRPLPRAADWNRQAEGRGWAPWSPLEADRYLHKKVEEFSKNFPVDDDQTVI